ncbi:drebrin-like [Planoprotostelium fungivorum]|uniref:Drebrin-like n=1 Tax=Planoprotostelium fungivorum TaxID=1890364 RepID=A0A2P6MW43_9EUKA|nr:drebrin-like [Planoprotostelium fungivorum]
MSDTPYNPHYPPSSNPYQDPLSKAHVGTANVDDSKVDLSDPALLQAKKDVKDGKLSWVLFSYVGTSNRLKVESTSYEDSGSANIDEIVDELNHGKPMFAFFRIYLQNNTVPKFVYFSWNPAGVPPLLKGLMHGRSYDIGNFLSPYHASIDAQNEGDLSSEKILDRLRKAAGV